MHKRQKKKKKNKEEKKLAQLRDSPNGVWWKLHCPLRCNGNTINIWTTCQIHLKQYPKKGKQTQHDANLTLNEKKTYTHNRIRHIDTISLGNEKHFTQSTIWDFAIFHQRTRQIVVHFGYCFQAQIAMRHKMELWTCILIYTIYKSQATTTSNKILSTA